MSGVDEGDETDRTEDPTDAGTDADAGANTDPDPQTRRSPVVVVVEPETPGNVGTIARAMKNFGLSDLKLVDPPELKEDGEAYGFAGHAREDVLPNADEVTFDEIVANYHTVGTTAITGEDDQSHERFPFKTPVELRESLKTVDAPTAAIVFRPRGARAQQRGALAARRGVLDPGRRRLPRLEPRAGRDRAPLRASRSHCRRDAVARHRGSLAHPSPTWSASTSSSATSSRPPASANTTATRTRCWCAGYSGARAPTEREIHSLLGTFRKANVKLEHADHLAAKYDEPVYPESDRGRRPPRRQLL